MAVAVATHRPAGPSRLSRTRDLRKRVLVYGGLTLYAILAGLPVYWMVITTFRPDQDLYNLKAFPLFCNERGFTLDHLSLLFNRTGFKTWMVNTLIVSGAVVAITAAVSI